MKKETQKVQDPGVRGEQKPCECLESNKQFTNEVLERLGSQRRGNITRSLKKLIIPVPV